jgi:hypothetical protein
LDEFFVLRNGNLLYKIFLGVTNKVSYQLDLLFL